MTKFKIATLIVVLAVMAMAALAQAEVKWENSSWDGVLKRAKSENKHVFIDFYTTWCGPCKKLDKVTYQDEKVVGFLNSVVSVKLDAEKGAGEKLADQFKVVAYPTLVILDANGQEVDRFRGYLGPEDFLETMQGYIDGVGTAQYYKRKLEDNPNDIETLYTLGMKYVDTVMPEDAKSTLDKVVALDPDNESGRHAGIVFALGDVYYSAENFARAKAYFEQLLKEHKDDTEWFDRGQRRLAYTEHKLGHSDVAVATYMKYVDRYPDEPGVLNGFAWFCAQRQIGMDKALPIALKAVKLSNRDAGILDTLAELYFARGEYDDAIKIGKEALATDPGDQYFKDQVEKFEKAKADAESQARN